MKRQLPAGFVVPAQPVERDRPPTGPEWVHEIKHDGYRIIRASVRLWSRKAMEFTDRLPAITAAAARIKAKSFTLDGEAVVPGPDRLSLFDELRRREGARRAILCAFDLIEHDGADLRSLPLLERKQRLTKLLRATKVGIQFNEHIAEDGALVFAHACKLGAEGIVSKRIDAPYRSGPHSAWIKVRNPASIAVQRERSENWNK
jgi:bifunctional non-homologous end joining protein LigD